jgi:hypothetical protein
VVAGALVPWFSLLVQFAPVIAAFLTLRTHQKANEIARLDAMKNVLKLILVILRFK